MKATVKTEKTADICDINKRWLPGAKTTGPRTHSDDMTENWEISGDVREISAVFSRKGLSPALPK